MKRRNFLAALAAPFIVRPSLEDLERLTWKRTLYPAYPRMRNGLLSCEWLTRECLVMLKQQLAYANMMSRRYAAEFGRLHADKYMATVKAVEVESMQEAALQLPAVAAVLANSINIRKPQRFLAVNRIRGPEDQCSVIQDEETGLCVRGTNFYDPWHDRQPMRFDVMMK